MSEHEGAAFAGLFRVAAIPRCVEIIRGVEPKSPQRRVPSSVLDEPWAKTVREV
jgi:hypothetical protein